MPSKPKRAIHFVRIPADVWAFSDEASSADRSMLLNGPEYPAIVQEIARAVRSVSYRRERAKRTPRYYRLSATLTCRSSLPVALFHSATTGYRAQYFYDRGMGEQANRHAVEVFGEVLLRFIESEPKRTCTEPWLTHTLKDADAKAWIHQGRWLRSPRESDKLLQVKRWNVEIAHDKDSRKRARFAQLVPRTEDRIDVKGGFVSLDGTSLGTFKPDRSVHIHEQGFT